MSADLLDQKIISDIFKFLRTVDLIHHTSMFILLFVCKLVNSLILKKFQFNLVLLLLYFGFSSKLYRKCLSDLRCKSKRVFWELLNPSKVYSKGDLFRWRDFCPTDISATDISTTDISTTWLLSHHDIYPTYNKIRHLSHL